MASKVELEQYLEDAPIKWWSDALAAAKIASLTNDLRLAMKVTRWVKTKLPIDPYVFGGTAADDAIEIAEILEISELVVALEEWANLSPTINDPWQAHLEAHLAIMTGNSDHKHRSRAWIANKHLVNLKQIYYAAKVAVLIDDPESIKIVANSRPEELPIKTWVNAYHATQIAILINNPDLAKNAAEWVSNNLVNSWEAAGYATKIAKLTNDPDLAEKAVPWALTLNHWGKALWTAERITSRDYSHTPSSTISDQDVVKAKSPGGIYLAVDSNPQRTSEKPGQAPGRT